MELRDPSVFILGASLENVGTAYAAGRKLMESLPLRHAPDPNFVVTARGVKNACGLARTVAEVMDAAIRKRGEDWAPGVESKLLGSDELSEVIGRDLESLLKIRMQGGRVVTDSGSKSPVGLARLAAGILVCHIERAKALGVDTPPSLRV